MYSLILLALSWVIICVCILIARKKNYCVFSVEELMFTIIFGGLVYNLLLWFLINIIASSCIETENHIEHSYNIQSINNRGNLSGSFFLGTGRIDETEYFYTFVEYDKGYVRRRFDVNDSIIFEIENIDQPHINVIYKRMSGNWKKWFVVLPHRCEYYIYVPTGTIIQSYSIE